MTGLFTDFADAWAAFAEADAMHSIFDTQPPTDVTYLVWQIPVTGEVAAASRPVRDDLSRLPDLGVLDAAALHVSIALVGAEGPIEAKRELDVGIERWAGVAPFDIEFGPVNCFPTAVVAEVHGEGPRTLLARLTAAPAPNMFLPHMTLAAAQRRRPAGDVREVISPLRQSQTTFGRQRVDAVELCRVRFYADTHVERGDVAGVVPLA